MSKGTQLLKVIRALGATSSTIDLLEEIHAMGWPWKEINLALRWVEYEQTGRVR